MKKLDLIPQKLLDAQKSIDLIYGQRTKYAGTIGNTHKFLTESEVILIKFDPNETVLKEYNRVSEFIDDLAAVEKNNKYGFINQNLEEVIPLKYSFT